MKEKLSLNSVRLCVSLVLLSLLGGCGGAAKPFPIPPPIAGLEFLFATSDNQVLAYSINLNTGALGQPTTATGPASASSVLLNPAGTFLYAADAIHQTVDVFSFSPTNGAMAAVNGSPFSIQAEPLGIAMDPAGKFLYAPQQVSPGVNAFNISTGPLTAVAGSPFLTGAGPAKAIVDPTANFLYVSDSSDGNGGISAYTFNSASGAPTAIAGSPFSSLPGSFGGPSSLAVRPDGKFLFVCEVNLDEVVALPINANGSLGAFVGTPSLTGNHPVGIAVNPAGTYLYVANSLDATISVFSINASTGALTAITNSPFAAGATVSGVAIDPSGKYLYVTNPAANTITGFSINASTGALTQFAGQPAAAGTQPTSLTTAVMP